MASSAGGHGGATPNMSDFSSYSLSSAGAVRQQLTYLLDSKEKQLQQAGTLGQRVLAQQMELEERIRQLQEIDADKNEDDELDPEARDRYRELAETIRTWDQENAHLSSAFAGKQRFANGSPHSPSPSLPISELPREEPERNKASAAGTSAAQSRRAKNAAHRADDVEFAFEIGSGLLTEVRRLQSLLAERDKAIQDSKEEKDDLEKSVESLRTALRAQEQSADKYKEENWNLEVTLQELRSNLSDSQSSTQRLEAEHKRLTKLLASSRDTSDQHKNESERLKISLDEIKAKHETDIAQARKHAAGLQRDKSDLQSAVEKLKVDVAKAGRRLPRFGSPLTPNGPAGSMADYLTPGDQDDDVFSVAGGQSTNRRKMDTSGLFPIDGFGSDYADSSPDPSPSKPFVPSNHPSNEIEALQQRLAHANRQINTLKGTLKREKELRMDYRRKLEGSPAYPGALGDEEEDEADYVEEDGEEKVKPKATPFRSGGGRRGRGRGGLSLVQRLGLAAQSPSSEYNDDNDFVDPLTPPPVPPIKFHEAAEEDEDDTLEPEETVASPSPLETGSRTSIVSVEGMDPAFANVLRRSGSVNAPSTGSPLRQSVIARSGRGGSMGRRTRGSMPYQDGRPSSLVGQPEALAAELGLGGDTSLQNEFITEDLPKEMVEFGCQTDFEEPSHPPPVALAPPIHVSPPTSEMAVQVDPPRVPEPVIIPPVVTSEMNIQTDEEPAPVLVSTSTNTDPEAIVHVPATAQVDVRTPQANTFNAVSQTSPTGKLPIRLSAFAEDGEEEEDVPFERGRRTTLVPGDIKKSPDTSFSGDTTITKDTGRVFLAYRADVDEGGETETGAETDEDYQDARQSIRMTTTPSGSTDDFHSVMTMTDADFSDSDGDVESIKASKIASRKTSIAGSNVSGRPSSYYADVPITVSKGVSVEAMEPPKPEVKEVSVQTEDWSPPVPPPVVAPIPVPAPAPATSGFGLYRVGSTGQQFKFIAPPTSGTTVPSSPATPVSPAAPIIIPPKSITVRDSTGTFGVGGRSSHHDRKTSIESAMSSIFDDTPNRKRVPSTGPSSVVLPVDKSKPPMMVLPPPPRLPPPPNTMLPPSFIPERPPRPSSPPPAELIQRATTPTFGSMLSVGGKGTFGRQHGSSVPPQQLRQPTSTSSFRSTGQNGLPLSLNGREDLRREMSSTSLASDRSPRSSISSDRHAFTSQSKTLEPPVTPSRSVNLSRNQASTDPTIIHAITQTMIGEFLYKYTRRTIGKGHGQTRHRRFFWVHPYTKTLYWSSADPGSSNVSESSAKSAYIEGVRSVLDPNPMPPGLYQYSVVVSTPQREMKFTAPTKDRHDIWLNALRYLLSRPNGTMTSPATTTAVPSSPVSLRRQFTDDDHRAPMESPQTHRSVRSPRRGDTWSSTPRGQRSRSQISVPGSIGKRSGTPAVEYLRWAGPDSPQSPSKSFEHVHGGQHDDNLEFELHADNLSDDGYEGLENVRACCDGRHTVGHSGKHYHHDHHNDHLHNGDRHLDVHSSQQERPVSPAWSFRSRTASGNSHEGGTGTGKFSFGRGDDGKLRFGSRRSTKTVPVHDQ